MVHEVLLCWVYKDIRNIWEVSVYKDIIYEKPDLFWGPNFIIFDDEATN